MASTPPSRPIPITTTPGRARSGSVSSTESPTTPGLSPAASSISTSPFQAPQLSNKPLTPSSPILSYFFGKDSLAKPLAPTKPTVSTQLPPLPDEDDELTPGTKPMPILGHHRAMSMGSTWSRFSTSPVAGPSAMSGNNVPPNSPQDTLQRGAGVLRRLSLSGAFTRPIVPSMNQEQETKLVGNGLHRAKTIGPSSAEPDSIHNRRAARRATLSTTDGTSVRPRAPSPMGERMLKGHFDGFN